MHAWTRFTHRGVAALADHDPARALHWLGLAVEECPPARFTDLAKILFYLGVAFRKLGMGDSCIRSWLASQRLDKRGTAGKMLERFINEYGMERQPTEELDDWEAFRSIQLRRYLNSRGKEEFSGILEERLVEDLIRGYWRELLGTTDFHGWSQERKRRLFAGVHSDFPFVMAGETVERRMDPIVVDFSSGRRVDYDQRCPCGSGRPYSSCCGRIPGVEEIRNGHF